MRSETAVHERLLEIRGQLMKLIDAIDEMTLNQHRKKRVVAMRSPSNFSKAENLVSFTERLRGKLAPTPRGKDRNDEGVPVRKPRSGGSPTSTMER
jgi:hypothetical protein